MSQAAHHRQLRARRRQTCPSELAPSSIEPSPRQALCVFAFHVASVDSRKYQPEWARTFPSVREGQTHFWGWIWNGIRTVDQRLSHPADGLYPLAGELRIENMDLETHEVSGSLIAGIPSDAWHNMTTYWCRGGWECNGRVAYADLQNCV